MSELQEVSAAFNDLAQEFLGIASDLAALAPVELSEKNAVVGDALANIDALLAQCKVSLPDGTGREIWCWEYEGIERISALNGVPLKAILGERIFVENNSVVGVFWCNCGLRDVNPMACFPYVKVVELSENRIKDFSPLLELEQLELVALDTKYLKGRKGKTIDELRKTPGLQEIEGVMSFCCGINELARLGLRVSLRIFAPPKPTIWCE